MIQASELESKIILSLKKKKIACPINEVAKEIGHPLNSVSKTVSRLEEQGILISKKDFIKDARASFVSLNKYKIKVKKTHDFYSRFFIIVLITIIFSGIIAIFSKNLTNFILIPISCILGILPVTLYMAYNVYVTKDRITVYKIKKKKKKNKLKKSTTREINP